ncbi:MAG: hypothetical protein PUB96_07400, partial [Helicobacteraceae bacterium]|nr:hypothetical protein [Helicobacteraceae bacterium]
GGGGKSHLALVFTQSINKKPTYLPQATPLIFCLTIQNIFVIPHFIYYHFLSKMFYFVILSRPFIIILNNISIVILSVSEKSIFKTLLRYFANAQYDKGNRRHIKKALL